ncbi:MAG: thiamine pyrophosphate-binding protein [Thermoprotei archaeon]
MKSENARYEQFEAKTGGHWFAELLRRSGVQFVFGTTGAGMPDIQDAMVVVKPPKWVQGLHEFVSVSAAMGYALASGKPGVALIDRVVGTQNALGALYSAKLNFAPMVVFASENVPGVRIPTGEPEYHYHSGMLGLAGAWVKWASRVESLDSMPYDFERAFQVALSEPRGPTYLTLRQDLMAQSVERGFRLRHPQRVGDLRVPDDQVARRVVEEILSHEHPYVLVSHAGRNPEAVGALVRFAHTFGVGVVERRVYLNYPMSDAHHLGFASGISFQGVPEDADMLIMVEAGVLPHMEPPVECVVDLCVDPIHTQDVYEGGDYGGGVDWSTIRIVADTAPTLSKLANLGEQHFNQHGKEVYEERSARLAEEHTRRYHKWWEESRAKFDSGVLDGYSVGYTLNKHWGRDIVWVNGAITPRDGLLKNIVLNEPLTYFANPSGHLGVSVGMAYGVALADKAYVDVEDRGGYTLGRIVGGDRLAVCTLGDGEAIFGNISSGLWTVSHYSIPVVYVVLNNACWGIEWPPIERSPQHWAKQAGDYEFLDLDVPRIDFAKLGEAFGVHSATATTPRELDEALQSALETARKGRPAIVDVHLPKATGPAPSVVP